MILYELKIIALDGSGFNRDYANRYCLKIRGYNVKHYTKSHIAIDVESRIILYSQTIRGSRHDTKFAIEAIRSLKKYNIQYIIADKATTHSPYETASTKKLKL